MNAEDERILVHALPQGPPANAITPPRPGWRVLAPRTRSAAGVSSLHLPPQVGGGHVCCGAVCGKEGRSRGRSSSRRGATSPSPVEVFECTVRRRVRGRVKARGIEGRGLFASHHPCLPFLVPSAPSTSMARWARSRAMRPFTSTTLQAAA